MDRLSFVSNNSARQTQPQSLIPSGLCVNSKESMLSFVSCATIALENQHNNKIDHLRDPILRPGTPLRPILPTVDFSNIGGSGQPIVYA